MTKSDKFDFFAIKKFAELFDVENQLCSFFDGCLTKDLLLSLLIFTIVNHFVIKKKIFLGLVREKTYEL